MRWIVRGIIAILIVFGIGVGLLYAIPSARIAELATARLSAATGRSVSISGGVRPQLWPHFGIEAQDLVIGNPDWVGDGPMLSAARLDIGVAWAPLLRGDVQLDALRLEGPSIVVVRGADGRVSWQLEPDGAPAPQSDAAATGSTAPAQDSPSPARRLGIGLAEIVGGSLRYIDETTGQTLAFDNVDARLTMPDPDGPADLELSVGTGDERITLTADLAEAASFFAGNVSATDLSLDWSGGSVEFAGRAGLAPALDGSVTLDVTDPSPLLSRFGIAAPDLPEGLGRDRIAASGNVTVTNEGSIHLRGGDITLDGNTATAELDLVPGAERPLLRGNISAGRISMPFAAPAPAPASGGASGGGTGATAAAPSATGWSTAPIDASGLYALDTELSLAAEEIALGDVALDLLAARIESEDGRMVVDLTHAGIFDGAASGRFVLNGRGTFSARAEARLSDIALNPAVTALTGYDRLEGTGSAEIEAVAQGGSLAALMSDLDGSGRIDLGAGAIRGLDIAGMIRNFDANFRGEGARTVYDSVTASFTIADGTLANDDLALAAPWGGVTGRGLVDIGRQSLDYLVVPGVLRGDDGAARVAVPVRIEGPWHDLSYTPDLQALADQELSDEIDALESRATDELRDVVREELGVEIEEGASRDEAIDQIEEAIGDRVREELGEGLLRLFE
ncbi:AsmA family protein [Rhodobacterales bacterium HKCCE3408]|nr:AsmA family protein [Rhodobacterales bacterium HKCCE3408]